MNDTLDYMRRDPIHRKYHHDRMTFGIHYAFSENFVLPLSHDEVVHGKGSLLGRMPGDEDQRFANLRAYFAFMWGHPGKKLLFMGQDFAQAHEWNHDAGLDWHLLSEPRHAGVQRLVRDLNRLYRTTPALHELDCDGEGFEWIEADAAEESVYAWVRHARGEAPPVLVACNFTPVGAGAAPPRRARGRALDRAHQLRRRRVRRPRPREPGRRPERSPRTQRPAGFHRDPPAAALDPDLRAGAIATPAPETGAWCSASRTARPWTWT